jgi:hypothetical protein
MIPGISCLVSGSGVRRRMQETKCGWRGIRMARCRTCGRGLGIREVLGGDRLCRSCAIGHDAGAIQADPNRQLGGAALSPESMQAYRDAAADGARQSAPTFNLPEYPGERPGCTCAWDLQEFPDRWEATWLLDEQDPDRHPACQENARRWAPLVVRK